MFELIILIVLIVLVVLYFINNKKTNTHIQKTKIIQDEPNPNDSLLKLNIDIRKKIFNIEIIKTTESIIDELKEILPILNKDYKTSELTWVSNKMATNYLQKLLYPYMSLKENEQEEKRESLLESLTQIEIELQETIQIVKQNEISRFDTKAKFIKNRFK
ncbi:MAG TPA: hypothetical protein ENK66_01245 [Arcobacter sp.]|nr:hypothetical protein [Arcobacter sp.]